MMIDDVSCKITLEMLLLEDASTLSSATSSFGNHGGD